MALNYRKQIFAEAWLRSKNQTAAAVEAGYSARSAYNQGYRLMKDDDVQEYIRARMEENRAGADEVLMRLVDRANGSMAMFGDVDKSGDFKLDFGKAQQLGALHLIKKMRRMTERRTIGEEDEIERTTIEIELYDAQQADTLLGRYNKMFTDKIEVTDPQMALLADIRSGAVDYESLAHEFGESFARTAFEDAGIPVPAEDGASAPADED
ncbi:terminase small subunit [Phototrophicus methaneseepsis]|uniref:Terminase small subunit n=1 Tax=Phototrophicus methaneseepsis TaxID=2710758 RepID=A0A7S8E834_9CHLR|nr:terminase small subunit [Phototrophicus methaneseepsis]QPC82101.1 terminase small subunit [Phototrophicus methaneseepsis]